MVNNNSVNALLQESFKSNWDRDALSDYKGGTLTYGCLARKIKCLHIFYESCGIKKGDKIALCGRNQSNWGVSFLSIITYGAVAVPLLHEFKSSSIHHLVNHSDSRILIVSSNIWDNLNIADMPSIKAVISLKELALLYANEAVKDVGVLLNDEAFFKKYPSFNASNLTYHRDTPEELALINYTSGTTGFSKGVMLPYRSLMSNILFSAETEKHMNCNSNVVSMLPSAHMYGMMFEFLFEMTIGAHVHFLTRLPSPKVILGALTEIRPDIIISVPMIMEKIYKSLIIPKINDPDTKALLSDPVTGTVIKRKIRQDLMDALGGMFHEVIVGGAAFNREAEKFMKSIDFPFTIGYGMTECGPIVTYVPWDKTKLYSCGKAAPRMTIKINSEDPQNKPGEILLKGDNLFVGYYKNEEATKASFDEEGWFRTGDLGVMDSDGYLYIKGRCKSMILGPSGQNIYPEEIESVINNLPYVSESLIIEGENGILTALIYPDFQSAERDNLDNGELLEKLRSEVMAENEEFPNYCKVSNVVIYPEEFEKTPKRSIKRYLYQRND